MKTLLSAVMVLALLLTVSASAMASNGFVFNNYSAADGVAHYSPVLTVDTSRVKTVQVSGVATAGHAYTTLSGTFLLQCGPTMSGPWITCKDQNGNAVTTTSNATFTINDASPYMRGSWTKTSGQVRSWLFW